MAGLMSQNISNYFIFEAIKKKAKTDINQVLIVVFMCTTHTPARTLFISGLKSRVMKLPFFELKNDGKKWSRIYFEIDRAPSELLLPSAKISAQIGRIGLAA